MKHHAPPRTGMPTFSKRSPLLKTVSKSLHAVQIEHQDKIVVAVSGGPDSVCLLYLLREYLNGIAKTDKANQNGLDRLHVAHLHHGFRAEADEEAVFVESLCQSWGIACTVARRPVRAFCQEKRLSTQEGARQVRYAFLTEVAQQYKARWIALGHTADDQAETLLINLLRGTGGDGFRGIPQIRDGMIIRPLLQVTRSQILTFLQENKIPFREDLSNQDKRYLRNRIRHDLIPTLQTYNPNIKKTLLRMASVLTDETDFFNEQIRSLVPEKTCSTGAGEVIFHLPLFCPLHKALQRRLLRWGIGHVRGHLRHIGFEPIEAIIKIAAGHGEKSLSLSDLSIQKTGTDLILRSGTDRKRSEKHVSGPPMIHTDVIIPDPAALTVGKRGRHLLTDPMEGKPAVEISLSWSLETREESPFSLTTKDCSAFFDFDTITYPVTVRGWQRGDRFVPFGMGGRHKKLQDFFVDQKIPQSMRNQTPLLVCPKGILWVVGYRMDERFKVTDTTKQILSFHLEKRIGCR